MLTESDFTNLTDDQLAVWEDFKGEPEESKHFAGELQCHINIYAVPSVGRVVISICDYKGCDSDPQIVGPDVTVDQVAEFDADLMEQTYD